ncbi:helix-turn-helix domain-containing protein [Thorsellia anophelis]|uniref:DNA-binding transcriptional regulator, XRE-family HTH domain n=1 Tax=Thorsellia anophelis DSM 18579 TaxID=1123402 RepID=A0A1I0D6J0_9GAMM|nr:helix-turn-helix transcriptional regulator [Thorsellia anophelis]SET27848.1 DNA-binding transcriptional regulator, XRE-family HTH domain [Thorsellia anophelis DSM 18579]
MLSKALKLIRQYHGYKQVELAEKLGISKSFLSEIEGNKKVVSVELLNKYAQIFDMPVSSLVFFSENIHNKNLLSSKFKKMATTKILKLMEWLVAKNEKNKETQTDF